MELALPIIVVVLVIILTSIRQINEYERGIKFRFGKFNKIMNPGWNLILPIIDSFKKVDVRTKAVDVPEQEAITKDNVSIKDKNLHSNAITDKYYHKCGKLDIGNKIKVNYYRKRMVSMY